MKNVNFIVLNDFTHDSRVLKECLSLQSQGYKVSVIALHENGLNEKENIQGISVIRLRLKTKNWPSFKLIQLIKYLELALRIIFSYRDTDIIHCCDLEPLPIATIIKKLSNNKVKIVYDAHEYETERNGLKGISKRFVKWLEKAFIYNADAVITVSEGIALEYSKLYGIDKPRLVLNCPSFQLIIKENKFRECFPIQPTQKIFLYQGALTQGRGIDKLIEAFKRITNNDAVLMIMGYGLMEKKVKEAVDVCPKIFYQPAVPPNQLLTYTASADIGISMIENVCLSYYYCMPNKLLEYAMAGLPVLTSNLPEMKRLVLEYNCGEIIQDETIEAIIDSIERFMAADIELLKKNARNLAKKYNWETQEQVLFKVYQEL